MAAKNLNSIAGRLSLRKPQRDSLEILARLCEIAEPTKDTDLQQALQIIQGEYATVKAFDRDFMSLCFALATGVGKTRLMGAFISYLHIEHGIKHFFVLAPGITIYNKLIADFTPNTSKYVFKGIEEFSINPPQIITGDNYESGIGVRGNILSSDNIQINIFNLAKINDRSNKVKGQKNTTPRFRRLNEYIGESYFEYLQALPDLVLIMDESHRYRAESGMASINDLKPILGIELTATPMVTVGQNLTRFNNVIYDYPLARAMADGFVKEPAVVTQKNFDASQFDAAQLQKIKLEDGIRVHEKTKVELKTYAFKTSRPVVKPFVLVIARDINHATEIQQYLESTDFFEGRYKGKVIQVHSGQGGEEGEENIAKLLAVESNQEPTEIVIHVNMLKEGWDVTNLYTIIPLKAARARVLVEQSIGRGLRLPYGSRTGEAAIDRLSIIAHDKFQEVIDDANKADSPIQLQSVFLDSEDSSKALVTVEAVSTIASIVGGAKPASPPDGSKSASAKKPIYDFTDPKRQTIATAVLGAIGTQKGLASSAELTTKDVQAAIVSATLEQLQGNQLELPESDLTKQVVDVAQEVAKLWVEKTIDIPRIVVIPRGETVVSYSIFKLDVKDIRWQPVNRDILIETLRTRERSTISFQEAGQTEERLEDDIVRGLMDIGDISYDDHADLLYDLSGQFVSHLRGYLKDDEEVRNVLLFYQKNLVNIIYAQMVKHQTKSLTHFDVRVSNGFSKLLPTAYTAVQGESAKDFRDGNFDKQNIGRIIFTGFQKSLYDFVKFDSDTERRFAVLLENLSEKWFKPVKCQFKIFYKENHDSKEYIPDFVAETKDSIYLVETKARNEIDHLDVQAKKAAAIKWCEHATAHTKKYKGKPWKYLLIAHDEVQDNRDFAYFRNLQ